MSKHDNYVDALERILSVEYQKIKKNVTCKKRGRDVTEIDLLCFVDAKIVDIYEVKCNYSKKQEYKALKQLNKQYDFVKNNMKLEPRDKYMYIGSEDKLYEK